MTVAATVCRIVLGLLFIFAGVMDIVVTKPAPQPGLAGAFGTLFARSHWMQFIGAAQFVAGVFLLLGVYVPVALIILAGFLYNSFAFHITTMPATTFIPVIVIALWAVVAWRYRGVLSPLFVPRPLIRRHQPPFSTPM